VERTNYKPVDTTFKPTFAMMMGRTLAFGGAFFIPVTLARLFDQAEFGTYKQLLLIWSTLYAFAQLGMAESLFYFLPRNSAEGGKYLANALLFLAAAGLAGLAFLVGTAGELAAWMGNGALARHMPLIGVFFVFTLASATLEIVLVARSRYLPAALSFAVSDLLRAALFILPAVLLQRLEAVLAGAVVYGVLRLCAGLVYFKWEFGSDLRPDLPLLKAQLAYAVPFGIAIVGDIVQANFHHYAVSYQFDAATFAIYSVGCLSMPIVDFVQSPAANVMMVRMGQAMVQGDRAGVLAIWHDTTRRLALMFLPLMALLMITARELIVLLFTERYLASVPVFIIWSTSIFWSAFITDGVLRVYADTRFLLVLSVVRLVLNVVLMFWFIRALGLPGAVLVAVMSVAVSRAVAVVRLKKLLGVGSGQVLPWRQLGGIAIAAVMAALAALALKQQLGIAPLPALLVTGVVYTATYVGLLLRLHLLSPGERLTLWGWMRRVNHGARHAVGMART
jgi:O-antigen/teichoic acid export membrane protein